MSRSDEGRRLLAASYLQGRTLEAALAQWRADYDAPTFRERRVSLARLGSAIRRLAAEHERRRNDGGNHPDQS